LTEKKDLLNACAIAIKEELGVTAEISTDGGTSDGRFMAKICDQVIEFGLINESIHKINEHTTISALDDVTKVYISMLNKLLAK
jgi:succinyl-diaminopimelate desuccinylase